METVTIRELRQSWPAVEKRLAAAGELTVTRDGESVALLMLPRKPAAQKSPRRFNAAAHAKWLEKIWGEENPSFTSETVLAAGRAGRDFLIKPK